MYRKLLAFALIVVVVCCVFVRPAPADKTNKALAAQLTTVLQTAGFTGTIESRLTSPTGGMLGRPVNPRLADLGRNLFFDKILGLNNDNACAGCHSPFTGMGDTQPIAIGVDNNNIVGPRRKGPRNMRRAPLFLNTPFYRVMMWNSRFVANSNNNFSPGPGGQAGTGLMFPAPEGFGFHTDTTGAANAKNFGSTFFAGQLGEEGIPATGLPNLSTAQIFMPTVQFTEMAGFHVPGTIVPGSIGAPGTKNRDSTAVAVAGPTFGDPAGGAHAIIRNRIVDRLNDNRNYRRLFSEQFPSPLFPALDARDGGINYTMVALAIAEFEFSMVRANAPIDRFARGDTDAMTTSQIQGALIFFGKAKCATCHAVSGNNNEMFTDFGNHVAGVPQLLPRRTNAGFDVDADGNPTDLGWADFTNRVTDNYKFRTSPLRNIALAPFFFHDGAFNRLEDAIAFHLSASTLLPTYRPEGRVPHDLTLASTAPIQAALNGAVTNDATNLLNTPITLTNDEFRQLVDFVRYGLLDPRARPEELIRLIPGTLPSGMRPLQFE